MEDVWINKLISRYIILLQSSDPELTLPSFMYSGSIFRGYGTPLEIQMKYHDDSKISTSYQYNVNVFYFFFNVHFKIHI